MKKLLLIMAASLAVAIMFTGCAKKDEHKSEMEQQLADYGKNASDNVDINKVEGKELTEKKGKKQEEEIGNYKVSIEKAKAIDYADNKILLVQFEFENNGSEDINFAGALKVEAEQGGAKLPPLFVSDVEGVDVSALAQMVSKGEKINVQKTYNLMDEESPVTISVYAHESSKNPGVIEKTFNLK